MIIATLPITRQTTGENDLYGQPILSPPVRELVAPVKMIFGSAHSTVRIDSAASKGHAYEEVDNVVFLAKPTSGISVNDVITVLGHKLRADKVHMRFRVGGAIDHIEVHCVGWK